MSLLMKKTLLSGTFLLLLWVYGISDLTFVGDFTNEIAWRQGLVFFGILAVFFVIGQWPESDSIKLKPLSKEVIECQKEESLKIKKWFFEYVNTRGIQEEIEDYKDNFGVEPTDDIITKMKDNLIADFDGTLNADLHTRFFIDTELLDNEVEYYKKKYGVEPTDEMKSNMHKRLYVKDAEHTAAVDAEDAARMERSTIRLENELYQAKKERERAKKPGEQLLNSINENPVATLRVLKKQIMDF